MLLGYSRSLVILQRYLFFFAGGNSAFLRMVLEHLEVAELILRCQRGDVLTPFLTGLFKVNRSRGYSEDRQDQWCGQVYILGGRGQTNSERQDKFQLGKEEGCALAISSLQSNLIVTVLD